MRKIFKKLAFFFAAILSLTVSSSYSVKEVRAEDGTWTLVSDASTLAVGDQVVIAAKDADFAMSVTQNSNNRAQVAITKSGDTITIGNDVQILTLEKGKIDNTFAFNTGTGYLYAASSSKNYLRTETNLSENSSWEITIDADGTATVIAQGSNTRNVMQYNQSSSLFACYSSASQKAISLYKLNDNSTENPEPETPTYSFSLSAETNTIKVDAEPLLITPSTEYPNPTYTWESSNPEVATVSNGYVTPLTVGTTTITATIVGSEVEPATIDITVYEEKIAYLITDAKSLSINDEIIIVANAYDYAMSEQTTNNRSVVDVTKEENEVKFNSSLVQPLILKEGNIGGTYALYTGDGYLYAASSSSNYLRTETTLSNNSSWSISIDDDIATIISQGEYTRNTLKYNKNNKIFSCYASGQEDISIYRIGEKEESLPKISIDEENLEKKIISVDEEIKIPYIIENAEIYDLSWNSSNDNVATVSNDGTVKGVSVGSTIITVHITSGELTNDDSIVINVIDDRINYVLVENTSQLNIGDKIIVAASEKDVALSSQTSDYRSSTNIERIYNKINITDDVEIITLEQGLVDNTFALKVSDGYLCASSSENNYLNVENILSENSSWSISIEEGITFVTAQGTNTKNSLRYNVSSPRFTCYSSDSTMQNVVVYKEVINPFCNNQTSAQLDFNYNYNNSKTVNMKAIDNGNISATNVGLDSNIFNVNITDSSESGSVLCKTSGIRITGSTNTRNGIIVTSTKNIEAINFNNISNDNTINDINVKVNGEIISSNGNRFVINSTSFTIELSGNTGFQFESLDITYESDKYTYTFENTKASLRYSASINAEAKANVTEYGFLVSNGTQTKKVKVNGDLVLNQDGTYSFAMVLKNIDDFNVTLTVTAYVVYNGDMLLMKSSVYSVMDMVNYYIENAEALSITNKLDVLTAFKAANTVE